MDFWARPPRYQPGQEPWRKIEGPWNNEPDFAEFPHAGYVCVVSRHQDGHLCGYVGVPHDHRLYASSTRRLDHIDVHGLLTWAEDRLPPMVKTNTTEGLWWFGFDCAQNTDLVPMDVVRGSPSSLLAELTDFFAAAGGEEARPLSERVYRTFDFAVSEVKKLAEILAAEAERLPK